MEKAKWKPLVSVGFMASPNKRITTKSTRVLEKGRAIYGGELCTLYKAVPSML